MLLLGALTADLQTECVTTRMLTAVGLLFTILMRYQPGGPTEKAAVLSFLSNPVGPANLSESQASLRRWLRLYNRTAELRLHYPDPSLLMKGLDKLSHLVAKTGHASFRLSSYRHSQRLDYEPTQASVLAYAQVLLGELEQQLLGQDHVQAEKRARILKTQVDEDYVPKEKTRPPVPKSSVLLPKPKAKGGLMSNATLEEGETRQTCKFFESANGCRYGKSCKCCIQRSEKGQGGVMNAASTHLRPMCPRTDGPEEAPSRRNPKGRRVTQRELVPDEANQRSVDPKVGETQAAAPSTPQAKAPPLMLGPKLSKLSLGNLWAFLTEAPHMR